MPLPLFANPRRRIVGFVVLLTIIAASGLSTFLVKSFGASTLRPPLHSSLSAILQSAAHSITKTHPIPKKIWQTARDPSAEVASSSSWHRLNPDWRYEFLTDERAASFVNESFAVSRPDIVDTYYRIETPILRIDLLRYLLLWKNGGMYADVNVECIEPIAQWIPEHLREAGKVGMLLGIEYDDETTELFPPLFVSQYTMVSRPDHLVMGRVVDVVMQRLNSLGDRGIKTPRKGVISAAKPRDVLNCTGPWGFGHTVFSTIAQLSTGNVNASFDTTVLHHLHEPRLLGDVLILPINGFGSGQHHSRSGQKDMGQRVVQHKFTQTWMDHGTWRLSFQWKKEKPPASR